MLSMIELKIVANTGRERIEIPLTTNEMPSFFNASYKSAKLYDKQIKMLKEEKQTNGTK